VAQSNWATKMRRNTALPLSRREFVAGTFATALPMRATGAGGAAAGTTFVAWLSSNPSAGRLFSAFRSNLHEMGYVEGTSIRVEAQLGTSSADLRMIAHDFVARGVDIIVANGRGAIRAAQDVTADVPIVMAPVDDPYEFVPSLSHPGANITGLALQQTEIDVKQIEFLKVVSPSITKLAILNYYGDTYYSIDSAAHSLGVQTIWIKIERDSDVGKAFASARAQLANGLLIVNTDILGAICDTIARGAIASRLPVAGSWHGDGRTPLLLAYAADDTALQQRAAAYVDRLLSGAKPQDLPIEQVTKFELGVNLVMARSLGLTIPAPILVRADYVVE